MAVKLKDLNEQVMVITGASSGIGLTTARMAAERGCRLVLASRNEEALTKLTHEINSSGGNAVYVVADVGNEGDMNKVAAEALNKFGGFDTWVNNAGVSVYGKLEDVPIADMRQVFETNFWGVVYGSLVAARNLKTSGGAIINVGSTLSDRAIPIQGIYCASKHAVKGFTDALRMELEADGDPISVTLVKRARSIRHTPITRKTIWASSPRILHPYMRRRPSRKRSFIARKTWFGMFLSVAAARLCRWLAITRHGSPISTWKL